MERELRKLGATGDPVLMGDGQKWLVPSPDTLTEQDISAVLPAVRMFIGDDSEDIRGTLAAGMELALACLRVNYPGLTRKYVNDNNLVTLHHSRYFSDIASRVVDSPQFLMSIATGN